MIANVAVIDAFESGVLDLPDFYFTGDDYVYRFEPEAKERFLDLVRDRLNSAVGYKGRVLKWDTVIEQKTAELSRCLIGRSGRLDFSEPAPYLERTDNEELRRRVLALTSKGAASLGIGKSTLHYLRKSARYAGAFMTYRKVRERLEFSR